jgi:hypothetical protein
MTPEEIRELLENNDNEDYGSGWSFWLYESDDFVNISPNLQARRVYARGGGEGGGESVEIVIEVRHQGLTIPEFNGSRFFQKLGSYYSHAGVYWDDYDHSYSEVSPVIKQVTVYEKV